MATTHVAELEPGDHEVVAVDVAVARRRAPALLDRRAQRRRAASRTTRGSRRRGSRSGAAASCSPVRNSGSWPPAATSACISASPSAKSCSTPHPVGAQRVEQRDRAGRRVEADGHADLRVLGRERGQQDGDPALGGRRVAQPRVRDREPRDPRAALGIGDVARHGHADRRALGVALLERDDAAEEPPVELRDRDLRRGVERRQAAVGLRPRRARRGRADGLDHRHVERRERAWRPTPASSRRRPRARRRSCRPRRCRRWRASS